MSRDLPRLRGDRSADLPGEGSRGLRLDRAARRARGDVFFFVHADSRPPGNALEAIRDCLEAAPPREPSAWPTRTRPRPSDGSRGGRICGRGSLGLPFGDQGLFCRREAYERSGGYRDLAICEDVDIVRRVKRAGRFRVLREKTVTSPRRYRERGAFRQVLRNWRVLPGFFAGVSTEKLERWYKVTGAARFSPRCQVPGTGTASPDPFLHQLET